MILAIMFAYAIAMPVMTITLKHELLITTLEAAAITFKTITPMALLLLASIMLYFT